MQLRSHFYLMLYNCQVLSAWKKDTQVLSCSTIDLVSRTRLSRRVHFAAKASIHVDRSARVKTAV